MPDVMCIGEYLVEFVSTQDNVSLPDAPWFIKAPGGARAFHYGSEELRSGRTLRVWELV